MLEQDPIPLMMRVAEAVGSGLRGLGVPLFKFTPEALLQAARRQTGLTGFDADANFHEALERLCASAENDGDLHFLGRTGIHGMFVTALRQRLLLMDLRRREPKRLETPLENPLLVVGFPRSGTTLLHRLLALANDARSLAAWEVQHPLPPVSGPDRRRQATRVQFKRIHQMVPSLALKHSMTADDPEEDFWLLNPSLHSPTFFVFAPLTGYEEWFRAQDMREPYRMWASLLSNFQSSSPDHRLTLKSPSHLGHVDAAVAAVPQLGIVQVHRDPVEVLGSLNSLIHTLYATVSRRSDPTALGRRNLERLRLAGEDNVRARTQVADHILDVEYEDLRRDPVALIEHTHTHFSIPFTDDHAEKIRAYMAQRPQHQHGRHEYDLAECGLSESEVRQELGSLWKR